MPNIKSAKKRAIISEKRSLRNRAVKSAIKTRIKKFEETSASENREGLDVLFKETVSALDKAALKGVIHKNKANRNKSRLAKMLGKTAE